MPFLDHRVLAFSWRLPVSLKIRGGRGKWILRQVLHRYVPPSLIDRPKTGFAIPLDAWLRGPLREWAEELLDARKLSAQGLLDAAIVRTAWSELLAGTAKRGTQLWNVLMLQAWLAAWAA
jgi:asparagine synthase (glutamine-hydrolysing)